MRLRWLRELNDIRKKALDQAAPNPTVLSQMIDNFLFSPTSEKTFELLAARNYDDLCVELADAIATMFGFGGTLACELSNKSTRKQQRRAQEHCKVAGERMAWPC